MLPFINQAVKMFEKTRQSMDRQNVDSPNYGWLNHHQRSKDAVGALNINLNLQIEAVLQSTNLLIHGL